MTRPDRPLGVFLDEAGQNGPVCEAVCCGFGAFVAKPFVWFTCLRRPGPPTLHTAAAVFINRPPLGQLKA